ncbi:DUF1835 domain-containing protein [Desulfovibrio inopinatus]|uniref:DUF1835 domain-containing protein n=1 Tax=Desulfovibrio inopinatus TaxID=102109 RepID=UPI000418223A|nr:DUF1835 domain-containing protein [Desulfovibrio inopinatus]
MRRMHVRCGSDIRDLLDLARLEGTFFEFSDPVCQGPLLGVGRDDSVIAARSHFLAHAYGFDTPEKEEQRLEQQYATLDRLQTFDDIVLWFEHDLYDQSILIRILAELAEMDDTWRKVRLVNVSRFVGKAGFFGLGNLKPRELAALERDAEPLTAEMVACGLQAWTAFCTSDPETLYHFAQSEHPGLPWLAAALKRHLQELPWTTNGLSLTERRILEAAAQGDPTPVRIFRRNFFELENAPYLGDAMFWYVMHGLSSTATPALTPFVSPCDPIGLTDFGHQLLANSADFFEYNTIDRWWGGLHMTDGRWRYNGERPVLID